MAVWWVAKKHENVRRRYRNWKKEKKKTTQVFSRDLFGNKTIVNKAAHKLCFYLVSSYNVLIQILLVAFYATHYRYVYNLKNIYIHIYTFCTRMHNNRNYVETKYFFIKYFLYAGRREKKTRKGEQVACLLVVVMLYENEIICELMVVRNSRHFSDWYAP